MPISNWWTVDDALMRITGGPYLWDGTSAWTPPSGQRAVNNDPAQQGYSWAQTPPSAAEAGLTARVVALEARLSAEARGVKDWPAVGILLLGATSTQRVTFKTQMPSTGYTASAVLTGPAAQSFAVSAVAVIDRQTVDVTVKAGLAVTLTAGQLKALVFTD